MNKVDMMWSSSERQKLMMVISRRYTTLAVSIMKHLTWSKGIGEAFHQKVIFRMKLLGEK